LINAPLTLYHTTVKTEWIDNNGHMNVAYYVMIGDHATDKFFDYLGMDNSYCTNHKRSNFALDMRIIYLKELMEDAPVKVRTQLLDFDTKRIHFLHYIDHAHENFTACLNESVGIHVDMVHRKSTNFPINVYERIKKVAQEHQKIPIPESLDRTIGIG